MTIGEEIRVDFNTGSGGGSGAGGPSGGTSGPPPRVSGGAFRGDFNLSDPVQSFINTVRNVAFRPVDFFRGIPRRGDFLNPLAFALICVIVSSLLGGLIGFVVNLGFTDQGVVGAFVGFIFGIIRSLISAAIGLFIGAIIWWLLSLLFARPNNTGYEATFRVAAYSSVVYLVSWIPVLGWIVGGIYGIYLGVVGIREVHGTTTGRAALVVLVPIVVIGGLALLIFGVALLAIFAAASQQ
jgi:hypothetical protein